MWRSTDLAHHFRCSSLEIEVLRCLFGATVSGLFGAALLVCSGAKTIALFQGYIIYCTVRAANVSQTLTTVLART